MFANCKDRVQARRVTGDSDKRSGERVGAREVDAVLTACRLLVAISAQSLSVVDEEVSVVQLRILVVVASRGSATLSAVAAATGLHVSKASRTCDRMVHADLLFREPDPSDRRSLHLTLTAKGRDVVDAVSRARRAAITPVLRRLPAERRRDLVAALNDFVAAGGEPAETSLWALGWVT